MEDSEIVRQINQLVGTYRHLERQHGGVGLSAAQRQELGRLQARIDENWALLRERRAARYVGGDPENPREGRPRRAQSPRGRAR